MFKNLLVFKPSTPETKTIFQSGLRDRVMDHEAMLADPDSWEGCEVEDLPNLSQVLHVFRVKDPLEHEFVAWGYGANKAFADAQVKQTAGGTIFFAMEKRERRLESAIIQRATSIKCDELAAKENRVLRKNEIAGIKSQVVMELLPKAFIKVKQVLVAVTPDYLLVGTGSIKEADEIVTLIRRSFTDIGKLPFSVAPLAFNSEDHNESDWLSDLLVNGKDDTDKFRPRRSVAFKGVGTARFKDVELSDDDIQHLTADKLVISLEVAHGENVTNVDEDFAFSTSLLFDLTDQLAFKRIRFSDVILDEAKADAGDSDDMITVFECNAALVVPTLTNMIKDLERSGGSDEYVENGALSDWKVVTTSNNWDEDEL